MTELQEYTIEVLKASIWSCEFNQKEIDSEGLYKEFENHSILGMVTKTISDIPLTDIVRNKWKLKIYQQLIRYYKIKNTQEELLKSIYVADLPVVVLKGSSAAKYYPMPEYRSTGDIDLLVRPEDFDKIAQLLDKNNYKLIKKGKRHDCYIKDGVAIELHHYFSSNTNANKAAKLDQILYNDIVPGKFILSEQNNGLVLLEHIAQHIESGIGLRQIVDWMMYVAAKLDDENWKNNMQELVDSVGMTKLAKTVTRMCQLYLGLDQTKITWCNNVDETLCLSLIEYVMMNGNLGHSRNYFETDAVTKIPTLGHPILLFKYIQYHGEENWTLLKKKQWLKPLAWIYQCWRYYKMMLNNKMPLKNVVKIYDEAERRRELFKRLELTRE